MRRREFLIGVAAATAVTPSLSPAIAVEGASPARALPAWKVGTPGEMDWRVVFAEDAQAARLVWFAEEHGDVPGAHCEGPCSVDDCECYGAAPDAERSPQFDDPQGREPSRSDLLSDGWTMHCDRCGYECRAEDNAFTVAQAERDELLCRDCATPAEIKAHDLEEYEHMLRNDWIDEAESGDRARLEIADAAV